MKVNDKIITGNATELFVCRQLPPQQPTLLQRFELEFRLLQCVLHLRLDDVVNRYTVADRSEYHRPWLTDQPAMTRENIISIKSTVFCVAIDMFPRFLLKCCASVRHNLSLSLAADKKILCAIALQNFFSPYEVHLRNFIAKPVCKRLSEHANPFLFA